MKIGNELCTKNSQRLGNAVIVHIDDMYIHVMTDWGNFLVFTEEELLESYEINIGDTYFPADVEDNVIPRLDEQIEKLLKARIKLRELKHAKSI